MDCGAGIFAEAVLKSRSVSHAVMAKLSITVISKTIFIMFASAVVRQKRALIP